MKKTVLFLILAFLTTSWEAVAKPVRDAHVEAELISEVSTLQAGQPFWVALRLKMDEGWHTYWKHPGDSGLATSVAWQLPQGFQISPLYWPYPSVLKVPPFVTYGYGGEVFLLSQVIPPKDLVVGETVRIKSHAKWLACEKQCIPGEARLELDVPVGTKAEPNAEQATAFHRARERLPQPLPNSWNVHAKQKGKKMILSWQVPPEEEKVEQATFFPEEGGVIEHAAPQKLKASGQLGELELVIARTAMQKPQRLKGVLLLNHSQRVRAFAIDVPVKG